jgi:hypothetical protein
MNGSVEKGRRACAGAALRLRAEALRRASVQAGRPLAVLTYSSVRSARPSGCGLPFERPQDWTRPFGQTQGMLFEHSRMLFVWLSGTHLRINRHKIAIIQQSLNGQLKQKERA